MRVFLVIRLMVRPLMDLGVAACCRQAATGEVVRGTRCAISVQPGALSIVLVFLGEFCKRRGGNELDHGGLLPFWQGGRG